MSTIVEYYADALQRWQASADAIRQTKELGPAAEPAARQRAFLDHQLRTAGGDALWAGVRPPPLSEQFGMERVFAANDMLSFDTLQKAIAIGRFVGMVSLRDGQGSPGAAPLAFATGSMVSPRLLLTNHHVLGTDDEAAQAVVKFDYQLGEDGLELPASVFALRPDEFFVTDPRLDYTLVAVAETAEEGTPLAHFGWNRLNGEQGKILRGYPVNIIQHPEGGYKQIVLSNNKVLDLVKHFFLYEADTLPGSSGAPVFSKQWEIVALHRRGVPRMDGETILTKGGQAWKPGTPQSEIDWVGNEGTRVSSLVADLRERRLEPHEERLRADLLNLKAPSPFLVAQQARGGQGRGGGRAPVNRADGARRGNSVSVTIPLQLTITIGQVLVQGSGAPGPARPEE